MLKFCERLAIASAMPWSSTSASPASLTIGTGAASNGMPANLIGNFHCKFRRVPLTLWTPRRVYFFYILYVCWMNRGRGRALGIFGRTLRVCSCSNPAFERQRHGAERLADPEDGDLAGTSLDSKPRLSHNGEATCEIQIGPVQRAVQ